MGKTKNKSAAKNSTSNANKNISHNKQKVVNGFNLTNLLTGPLKLLCEAVEENREVIISLRNNHKMYAKVKAFDKHCNILLYDVKEVWSEKNWENKTHVSKERYISQVFLRGDNIIIIVKCPPKKKHNKSNSTVLSGNNAKDAVGNEPIPSEA